MNALVRRPDAPRNRRLSVKPPQKQCKDRERHPAHFYERADGLIWSCQGRQR